MLLIGNIIMGLLLAFHAGAFHFNFKGLPLRSLPAISRRGTATIRSAKRLQPVDYTCLLLACRELNNTIVPAKFENALQPDGKHLYLQLKTGAASSAWLELSWQAAAARVGLAPPPPQRTDLSAGEGRAWQASYALPRTLRSILAGKFLVAVSLPVPYERVAKFEFAASAAPNSERTHSLVVEVVGARSNVVLVESKTDVVLAAAYQVGPSQSVRPVQTGSPYVLPPRPPKVNPSSLKSPGAWRLKLQAGPPRSAAPPLSSPSPSSSADEASDATRTSAVASLFSKPPRATNSASRVDDTSDALGNDGNSAAATTATVAGESTNGMRESAAARQRASQRIPVWRQRDGESEGSQEEAKVVVQLYSTFAGISPCLAREMITGALLATSATGSPHPTMDERRNTEEDDNIPTSWYLRASARASSLQMKDLDDKLWKALYAQWATWMHTVALESPSIPSSSGSSDTTTSPAVPLPRALMLLDPKSDTSSSSSTSSESGYRGYSVVDFKHYRALADIGDDSVNTDKERTISTTRTSDVSTLVTPPPPLHPTATPGKPLTNDQASVLSAVFHYYGAQQRSNEFSALWSRAMTRAKSVCDKLENRCAVFEEALMSETHVDELVAKGDLLTAYAHTYQEGDQEVTCYDFESGAPVTIVLGFEPIPGAVPVAMRRRSAVEEAASLYREARRRRRAAAANGPLLEKAQAALAVAHSARSDLELLGDDTTQGDLAALRQVCQDMLLDDDSVRPEAFTETILSDSADSSMTDGGNDSSSSASSSSKSSNKKSKGKQAKSGKSTPPAKESKNSKSKMRNSGPLAGLLVLNIASDGTCTVNNAVSGDSGRNDSDDEETSRAPPVQVVVGRNSRQNDVITFNVAKPSDLWFHARGVAGSHVLLRLDPGAPPPSQPQQQAAADLAAYLSKGRGNLRTVVSVCSPKHLKRPSGPKVNGAVLMGQEEEAAYGIPENGAMLLQQHSNEEGGNGF